MSVNKNIENIENQKFDFSSKYGDWTQEGWANEMEDESDTEKEVETNVVSNWEETIPNDNEISSAITIQKTYSWKISSYYM